MAFTIDHKGLPGKRFLFAVRRQSDGRYWSAESGWTTQAVVNDLPELSSGHYSTWLKATTASDHYAVLVRTLWGGSVVRQFSCDAQGQLGDPKPKPKSKRVDAKLINGTLHVAGQKELPDVVLEDMSSNGVTMYTAIRWRPSGITSCNCPGWTTNAKQKGKSITERSCKHTKRVASMQTSVYLGRSILPPPAQPPTSGGVRPSRCIELD